MDEIIYKCTIPGNPVTKKNSQRIVTIPGKNGARGFSKILPSKQWEDYEKNAVIIADKQRAIPIQGPLNVCCRYYMETRRVCDLVNLQEGTLDLLVNAGILTDDNYTVVYSMDGSRVLVDKKNPRVEITITKADCEGDPRDGQYSMEEVNGWLPF